MTRPSGVIPSIMVLTFLASQCAGRVLLTAGAARDTDGHSRAIASASAGASVVTVSACRFLPGTILAGAALTTTRFVPSDRTRSRSLSSAPFPTETMTTTAATPTTIPRRLSSVRSRCAPRIRQERATFVENLTAPLWRPPNLQSGRPSARGGGQRVPPPRGCA